MRPRSAIQADQDAGLDVGWRASREFVLPGRSGIVVSAALPVQAAHVLEFDSLYLSEPGEPVQQAQDGVVVAA